MLNSNPFSLLGLLALTCASGAMMSGCSTGPDAPTDISLEQLQGRGLIIVSYSESGSYGLGYQETWPGLIWKAVTPEVKQNHESLYGWLSARPNESAARNPTTMPSGRVTALLLAPGEYEFYLWQSGDYYGAFGGLLPNPIRFSVTPGTATYIGHIHLTLDNGMGYRVSTDDRRTLDLPIFYRTYTQIKPEQVRFAILSAAPETQAAGKR